MEGQMNIFDFLVVEDSTTSEKAVLSLKENFKIRNKVRLIELFSGVGAQAMAMKRLGVPFEHYRSVEFDKYPVASYNAIHGTDFPTMDVTKIHGEDLGIVDTETFTYLLTYLLISMSGFVRGWKRQRHD